ncbi:hypothetical protein DRJ22_02200 [Candidatus Woesearchaeota archaeon]|nr:MAG: hypothetical protein DRJ22_02200 [Candidatus Woesearchaeota archaeon]
MAVLVACLGSGKGTWSSVFRLASMPDWEKVVFVGPSFVKDFLELKENQSLIVVDEKLSVRDQISFVSDKLGGFAFGEVGVSLFSGSGLLHMVVISALLKVGCGVKLVHFDNNFLEL